MKNGWNDENITKVLKKAGKARVDEAVYERVWTRLEDKLAGRERHFWDHFVWRPLGHPVRWVLAACLCVMLTGVVRHQNSVEQAEIASYLISISDPSADVTGDTEVVRVSALLSEQETFLSEEESEDPGSEDGGLLL